MSFHPRGPSLLAGATLPPIENALVDCTHMFGATFFAKSCTKQKKKTSFKLFRIELQLFSNTLHCIFL